MELNNKSQKRTAIVTVSMPTELQEFMDLHNLSPSTLIQDKIKEEIAIFQRYNTDISKLQAQRTALTGQIQELFAFIEHKELFEEYRKWRLNYVLEKTKQSGEQRV